MSCQEGFIVFKRLQAGAHFCEWIMSVSLFNPLAPRRVRWGRVVYCSHLLKVLEKASEDIFSVYLSTCERVPIYPTEYSFRDEIKLIK